MHRPLVFVWMSLISLVGLGDAIENRLFSGSLEGEDRKTLLLRNFLRVNHLRRRIKRESAFDLLKLESQLDDASESVVQGSNGVQTLRGGSIRRDDALNDEKCQRACNDKLRSGLDMVKAHSSFGSVGVPSVVDRLDLQMFCRLDSSHDRCLRDCGFEIHFNMRDYVCRDRFDEMVANLACYERSAAQLKRKCGAQRCGPYAELEISLTGFGQRCRSLLCDLSCTEGVLASQCGRQAGERAAKFLVDYSRAQISAWMRDMSKAQAKPIAQIIPPSCARLFCDRFDAQNCTTMVETTSLPPTPPTAAAPANFPLPPIQSFAARPPAPARVPLARALPLKSDPQAVILPLRTPLMQQQPKHRL